MIAGRVNMRAADCENQAGMYHVFAKESPILPTLAGHDRVVCPVTHRKVLHPEIAVASRISGDTSRDCGRHCLAVTQGDEKHVW